MEKISLNGLWNFRDAATDKWHLATIPGCQYTDLMAAGLLPDPFLGVNEKTSLWPGEKDWVYEKTFNLSDAALAFDHLDLCFETVDCLATIYINKQQVKTCKNTHLKYVIDAKELFIWGENNIRVEFESPLKYVHEKQAADKMPINMNGVTGVPHIRKPQCHFGWDWGPILPPVGLTGDVYILAYNKGKITDLQILQHHESGMVQLEMSCVVEGGNSEDSVVFKVEGPAGQLIETVSAPAFETAKGSVLIKSPELWWTHDLSAKETQPLYTVTATYVSGGEENFSDSKKVGLRTIVLDRENDEYGQQFRFVLNGVPLFIKGANWIPADSFINRLTKEKLEYLVESAKFSNMNMLRVWGGGYYESDKFYDACDERGILVWQDFCFACAPYPFYDEAFLSNVRDEVECNVKRLRHRASLAVWCGNNEIEAMTAAWRNRAKLVKWTEKFFWNILPEELKKYDSVTPYTPTSPVGSAFLKKVGSDSVGDTHLWQVWHGLKPLDYYKNRMTRFCSEFGLESFPDMKTIEGFASPEDYNLKSEVMKVHQKCGSGNNKILFYIATRFRLPKKFEDLVYLSQIVQQECVKAATDGWRINRGRCNGAMYWQLNDCWPVSSWSSMDYEGRYKALQYAARRFNAPVSVAVDGKKEKVDIFVINDLNKCFKGKYKYLLDSWNGTEIASFEREVECDALSVKKVVSVDFSHHLKQEKNQCVLRVLLLDEDDFIVAEKTHLFKAEKNLRLPEAIIKYDIKFSEDEKLAEVNLVSNKFARFVKLDLKGSIKPFSDNYFDLLAAHPKKVVFEVPEGMTKREVIRNFSVKSLTDVEEKGSKFSDKLSQLGIRLRPMNVINWIIYHFI